MRRRSLGVLGAIVRAACAAGIAALVLSVVPVSARSQELGTRDGDKSAPATNRDDLGRALNATISGDPILVNARIGVHVVDLSTGDVLYARAADDAYNIASNTKLVTTAAALHVLGPSYRFQTDLYAEEIIGDAITGDLFVKGSGDPSVDIAALHDLVRQLSRRGIRRIGGGIVVDDTLFDQVALPPKFDAQPKEQAAFRAPVGALSLSFNAVTVFVRPNSAGVGPAKVWVEPPNRYVTIKGRIQTTQSGRERVRVTSREIKGRLELLVAGQLPIGDGARHYRRRISAPSTFFAAALEAQLRSAGIAVRKRVKPGRLSRGSIPQTATLLATHRSAPLAELIRGMGKYSNNFVAECLLKAIGAAVVAQRFIADTAKAPHSNSRRRNQVPRPATWRDGTDAISQFLTREIGLAPGSFRYDNGSGLFDATEMSPRQLTTLLQQAWSDYRYGPDLIASLSIGGVDGTLRRRFSGSPARGLVRAKTGTLATVSALSGYIARSGKAPLAFSIVINDQPRSYRAKRAARAIQDALVSTLARYLSAD